MAVVVASVVGVVVFVVLVAIVVETQAKRNMTEERDSTQRLRFKMINQSNLAITRSCNSNGNGSGNSNNIAAGETAAK